MPMTSDDYEALWDKINLDLWNEKQDEWRARDWESWLLDNLSFPFETKRAFDFNATPFKGDREDPFGIDHVMQIISIEADDEIYGIIVKLEEEGKIGYLPLCELEVTSEEDENFWPVREYAAWFAGK